ncbi:hypothetical protein EI534_07335 [Pseudomonas frederiksbergensis]|nr:hypothetical protein [Pseudomonas frederiksbergensis]
MPSEIIDLIKSIPSVVWAAAFASGITLFGVMLSNRSNTSRLVLQLNHDAGEKSKERISELRHEVYLKVVEDIENTNIHIGNLANCDLANLSLMSSLQAIAASIAKLKLVAEPETSILAGELSAAFGVLFFKLLPRLALVQDARTDIDINNSLHESSSAEVSRVTRDMNKFNEEGRQDGLVFQNLQSSYEFHSSQAQQYADAGALAYEVLQGRLHEFSTIFLPELKELLKIQLKVTVAIRKDLGIACDVADLQRQLERHWAVMQAGFGDAMKDLKGG